MRRLDRHIGSAVLLSILVVLAVILGLDLLFAYINELDELKGGYGAAQALNFTLLSLPRRLHDLLPLAALVGCLVGLGTLASNSELTIMRAAGVSIARITLAVMKPLLVLWRPTAKTWQPAARQSPSAVTRRCGPRDSGTARATIFCISTRCNPTGCCMA